MNVEHIDELGQPRIDKPFQAVPFYDPAHTALIAEAVNALPGLIAENERLVHAIERDRSTMADCATAIKTQQDSRFWLTEGRGSYEWNDDRYRQEFHDAAVSLLAAIKPIEKLAADLTNSPRESSEVREARRDLEAENERLRAALAKISEEGDYEPSTMAPQDTQDAADYARWSMGEIAREALNAKG